MWVVGYGGIQVKRFTQSDINKHGSPSWMSEKKSKNAGGCLHPTSMIQEALSLGSTSAVPCGLDDLPLRPADKLRRDQEHAAHMAGQLRFILVRQVSTGDRRQKRSCPCRQTSILTRTGGASAAAEEAADRPTSCRSCRTTVELGLLKTSGPPATVNIMRDMREAVPHLSLLIVVHPRITTVVS